jgi:hypothetical protein
MAKLISEAGEMGVHITDVQCEKDHLVLVGQIGVWKSRVLFPADEIWALVPSMMKFGVIRLLFRGAFRRRRPGPAAKNAGD